MASHDSSEVADRADARVCWSAVLHLRAGQDASLAGEDLTPPLDRLLGAVSLELETDRGLIPTAVRRAAVQLAEHIVHRSSTRIPRDAVGGHEPVGRPASARRGSAATDRRRSTVPFTRSIRLGRMG
jgi:hypothetical protein